MLKKVQCSGQWAASSLGAYTLRSRQIRAHQGFGAQEYVLLSEYDLCSLILYGLHHPGVAVTCGGDPDTCGHVRPAFVRIW